MKRITKGEARKRFEKGETIKMVASKLRAEYASSVNNFDNATFDEMVNSYSYYNCNKETGKCIHFYI